MGLGATAHNPPTHTKFLGGAGIGAWCGHQCNPSLHLAAVSLLPAESNLFFSFLASLWSPMLIEVMFIHACALSALTRVRVSISASASHFWLAATTLSVPEAGTLFSNILGLIVLQVNMTKRTE